jgi:histone deacetylase complex regulatory component SIN3
MRKQPAQTSSAAVATPPASVPAKKDLMMSVPSSSFAMRRWRAQTFSTAVATPLASVPVVKDSIMGVPLASFAPHYAKEETADYLVDSVEACNNERQLNFTDALSYLNSVKISFEDQPQVYTNFLGIMKDATAGLYVI